MRVLSLYACVIFPLALFLWKLIHLTLALAIPVISVTLFLALVLLWSRVLLPVMTWLRNWMILSPWIVTSIFLLSLPVYPWFVVLCFSWILLTLWGGSRFYPVLLDKRLHKARFARRDELNTLRSAAPRSDGLLMAQGQLKNFFVVRATDTRRELGNMLIVGPTRSGKGLLATSQLLTWKHSVIVNDIKGDLFSQTAGYRHKLGPVFVIDPTGMGHCYDPLAGKETEDEIYALAGHLLFKADEGSGVIFTQRATDMLTQLFMAAKHEGYPALPYARALIRSGLTSAAKWLNRVDPILATQFLDVSYTEANFTDRFLLSAWGTLKARMKPLLTEIVVRCFTHSDFAVDQLLCSERPVSVYIRWPERNLLVLAPLVRLLWGSFINELITIYDGREGKGCRPVLLLIDEAGRTAIPTLADHATTIVSRGITLWVAIQSLSQLEAEYGKARAQVLRDNMETQLYFRPADLATAQYLEERLGRRSGYAHSQTVRAGAQESAGLSEQGIPLLTAQDIMHLYDQEVLCFHRRLHPFKTLRVDWREHSELTQKHGIQPPPLSTLPPIPDMRTQTSSEEEIDIDELLDE